jgi:ornithine carbamoyltransferase
MYVFPPNDEAILIGSTEAGTEKMIHRTTSPEEALQGADVVVTDTWCIFRLPS